MIEKKRNSFFLICKRYYTNKDLYEDLFGRLYHVPKALSERGWFCSIFAASYKSFYAEKKIIRGVKIFSIPFNLIVLPIYFLRLLAMLLRFRPNFVAGSGDSHFGAIAVAFAKLIGAKAIFDVYDAYWLFGSNKFIFMNRLLAYAVKNADLVVTANINVGNVCRERWGAKKIFLLPNCPDLTLFKPRRKSLVRKKLGIDIDQKIVGYFGSMESDRGVEVLIDAIKLVNVKEDVTLLVAGKNNGIEFDSKTVRYVGQVSQRQVALLVNACDVVVIPYGPSALMNFGSSCKTGEYIASGVPIVSTNNENVKASYPGIYEEGAVEFCTLGDAKDMARKIEIQLEQKKVASMGHNQSWNNIVEEFDSVLKKL